jgi:GH25 family lysozyme M1 (1,4-beta-N-acetylmuramidase)
VLDLENEPAWDSPLNKVDYVKWVKAFCEEVAKVMDRKPIIYTYKAYLDGKLPADHKLGGYHLWIANYNKKDCRNVPVPNGWEYWDIWQFTEKGGLGANKNLDLNIARSEPWLLT